jgi:hypothetical protein
MASRNFTVSQKYNKICDTRSKYIIVATLEDSTLEVLTIKVCDIQSTLVYRVE